jgi:PAS domain S-box-containing protein
MAKKSEADAVKGLEQELQEQIDLTRTITENLGEGVCVLDENGRITFLNKAATDILGWTRADLLGELLHEPIFTHDAQGRPLSPDQHPLQPVIRENAIIHPAEAIFSGRNARQIPVSYTAAPIRNANDKLSAVVAFRDISERKVIEAELTELRRRLARSRERQRTHLAQELHDGPLQDLYAARYQLQAIKTATKHNQQLQQQLGLMEQLFQQISDSLRAIRVFFHIPQKRYIPVLSIR